MQHELPNWQQNQTMQTCFLALQPIAAKAGALVY